LTIQQELIEIEGNTKIGVVIQDNKLYDLEDQVKNLNNLGINYLIDLSDNFDVINDQIKELLYYINDYYISIPFINQVENDRNLIQNVYEFLFVDMYTVILPNFVQITRYTDFSSLDQFIQLKYSDDKIDQLKNDLLDAIQIVINSLSKFKELLNEFNISEKITDITKIIHKYIYYVEVISKNSNTSLKKFMKNYLIPVFTKYENDLIWRGGM